MSDRKMERKYGKNGSNEHKHIEKQKQKLNEKRYGKIFPYTSLSIRIHELKFRLS